jgi:hypothetical protein
MRPSRAKTKNGKIGVYAEVRAEVHANMVRRSFQEKKTLAELFEEVFAPPAEEKEDAVFAELTF